MRSNSGRDESRNNLRDPTIRDRAEKLENAPRGSHASRAKAPADHRQGRTD